MKNKLLIFALLSGLAVSTYGWEIEREMPAFLDEIQAELTYPMAWGKAGIDNFDSWRDSARAVVFDAMLTPPRAITDHNITLIETERREGYTARKYRADLNAYSNITFYVLVPDGDGPHPGVVLLHDHGGHYTIGKEKMIRPFGVDSTVVKDADGWCKQCYGGRYVGDYLASNGYTVIAHDALMWGDRGRREGQDKNAIAAVAGNFLMLGRSLSAFMTFDDLTITELFASLPEVDDKRIGCMGFSMGAYRSWMLAALSDRIKASANVCWMTTTADQLSWKHGREKGGHINLLPGLRRFLDYPHIASMACPNAAYFINGDKDKLFNPEGVNDAFSTMRAVWESQNASDKFKAELWPMPHDCGIAVQDSILNFFNKHL